jgi:peptidoglycan L-alanyl-D-glutamate endopeptidase CwlK
MPQFSQQSLMRLAECHPDLQVLFHEVIKTFDCTILQGYRGEADQNEDYASGKTQLKWPDSKHNKNPSEAVDVMPYLDNGKGLEWDKPTNTAYFAGYVMATAEQLMARGIMTRGVRYGGDWKQDNDLADNHFADGDHFELL